MLKSALKAIDSFAKNEQGDSVTWIVLIIIGVIIAVAAFLKFRGAPGEVGAGINGAGNDAASGLNSVRVQ